MAETRASEARVGGFTSLGRVIDYLFGRNALIGLASAMLLLISGYATWAGMNDFIVGTQSASPGRNLGGGITVSHHHLVVAVTVALTFLMWIALREAIGAQRRWYERAVTWPLYIFLVLWSVGFGYGFWWSLIAGQEATRTGLSSLQEEARDAGAAVAARLDAVRAQIDGVASWSDGQMEREERSGGSCGVASGAGRGPLYNARRSVRDSVSTLREGVTRSWLTPLQAELELLRKSATGIEGADPEERQRRFEATASQIRGSARNIASRSNEIGKTTAVEMRALADAVSVPPGQAGFSCFDPTLAQRLRQAADQAGEPATMTLRDVAFNEGPAGVANAVKNLWANLGSYVSGLVVFVFSGGTKTAAAGGDPITGRDMIALLATIGIDLGLFVLALLDPPSAGPVRRDGLASSQARLHLPSGSVVRELREAFHTATARAPGVDLEWVRRHFIHHNGASYFVIPNLYNVDRDSPKSRDEELRALAMNQLAGVFDDLELVRALTPAELKRFGVEEQRHSYTDLTAFRNDRDEVTPTPVAARGWFGRMGGAVGVAARTSTAGRIRNHGLFSKSQRALDIAGWSEAAQSDVEIFCLVDTEGLTPLLRVLNETHAPPPRADEADAGRRLETLASDKPSPPLIEHDAKA